jgi:hypothetical protein
MKFKEILYPSVLKQAMKVKQDLDGAFANDNSDEVSDKLDEYLGWLEDVIHLLSEYTKDNSLGVPCLTRFVSVVGEYSGISGYSESWKNFVYIIKLSRKVEDDGALDLEEEITFDSNDYELIDCSRFTERLIIPSFSHLNVQNIDESIGYINSEFSADELIGSFDGNGFSIGFVALYIKLISEDCITNIFLPYLLRNKNIGSVCSSFSMLKFLATSKGFVLHDNINCVNVSIPNNITKEVSASNSYQQFSEILTILSEVNERRDVLSRFLVVYHVLESFLFKIPLVNLGESSNYDIFSIRDFQSLYKETKTGEVEGIRKLFSVDSMGAFWNRNLDGKYLSKRVKDKVSELDSSADFVKDDCNVVLAKFGSGNFSDFSMVKKRSFDGAAYAALLYKFRCAIVHNKETEIHISYFNLTPSLARFIEELYLQPLLLLIYDLMSDPRSKIWYKEERFNLY